MICLVANSTAFVRHRSAPPTLIGNIVTDPKDRLVNPWALALGGYLVLALGSFVPVARRLIRPATPYPGGPSFEDSPWFSDQAKSLLSQHFERMRGTLGFWKNRAVRYSSFLTYSITWVTIAAVVIPILSQTLSQDPWARWLLTTVSAHSSILLALTRAFKVEKNVQAFRHGESDFYDLHRRLLDRPRVFGSTEPERLANYFEQAELIRRFIRTAETDNFPSMNEIVQEGAPRPRLRDKEPPTASTPARDSPDSDLGRST
jgi:hypothetical protein